jgi:hypothetical protein
MITWSTSVRMSVCPRRTPARLAELERQISEWFASEALAELVALSDPALRLPTNTRDRLAALEQFSSAWDFRRGQGRIAHTETTRSQDAGGSARWLIEATDIDTTTEVRIHMLADELGLVRASSPVGQSFDSVLVLGGARLSPLLRAQRAAELVKSMTIKPAEIVLLSSMRPVMSSERDATDTYAPGADSEFDLITHGAAIAFGLRLDRAHVEQHDEENPNASWRIWSFDAADNDLGIPIVSMAAPAREPGSRRANTADSYAFFAERHLNGQAGRSCLLVTTQIYVPYQHLEGVRNLALPFDLELETVGLPQRKWAGLQGMDRAANYLQEIRSVIVAARRLYEDYLVDGRAVPNLS